MKAEICEGEYCLPSTVTHASPLGPRTILYGTRAMSFLEIGSSNDRPISRLIAKMVRSGLVTACRLAGWPTRRSPSSVNATIDGVVRAPSEFSITLGVEPSMTATHELVVPRSMPITFAISFPCSFAGPPGPKAAELSGSIPPRPSSRRPRSSDPRFSTPDFHWPDFRWFGANLRPNLPVRAYIGGAIWRRKARKRRIFQALGSLSRTAERLPLFPERF